MPFLVRNNTKKPTIKQRRSLNNEFPAQDRRQCKLNASVQAAHLSAACKGTDAMDMMNANQLNKTRRKVERRVHSGFSLVEIMVVLVVLLIGILAIVRLFPPGFLSIARTAEVTAAEAINRQVTDKALAAENASEAIVALDAAGNLSSTVLPSFNADLVATDPSLAGKDPWYFSNINPYRFVMGESFRIPIASGTTGQGYGGIHPLEYGPVENTFTGTTDSLLVYGAALQRTIQASVPTISNPSATPVLRNEAEYAIDYDNLKVAFFPRLIDPARPIAFRQFTISYDYYVSTGGTISVQFQPNAYPPNGVVSTVVTVPDVAAGTNGALPAPVWQPLYNGQYPSDINEGNGMTVPSAMYLAGFPPAANVTYPYGMVRESEDVSRKFRLALPNNTVEAGGVPTWSSNDAYEYAWYSKQSPGNNVNPGILIFNPSGHNQPQVTSSGTKPLVARVDYRIFDNHVMKDDRSVPAQSPYTMPLSVPFLRLGGDVLDNSNPINNFNPALGTYNGIYRDGSNRTPDIIVYNVATGQEVGDWTNQNSPQGTGVLTIDPSGPTTVDQKTGVITLNKSVVEAQGLQSASLRIFYRTQKDWGVQVQKAAAHYREATAPGSVDFRHYFIGDGVTGKATRIYFAPCDAGKSVMLGEFYTTTRIEPYHSMQFQISADPSLFDPDLNLPFIDIAPSIGATAFSAQQTGRRVNNVTGLSLKSRVAWRDAQRWRIQDTDTILVQQPSQ